VVMGCSGSEEQAEGDVVIIDEEFDGAESESDSKHKNKIRIDLYVEESDGSSFAKQTVWCDQKMLFIGLIPTAIGLGQKHFKWSAKADDIWQKVTMVAKVDGKAIMPDKHQSLESLKEFQSNSWNKAVLVYQNAKANEGLNEEVNKAAAETVGTIPGSAQIKDEGEKELDLRAGQMKLKVFAAVPAEADDENFKKGGAGSPDESATVMYAVNFWATRKVIVEAVKDAANQGLHHLIPGADFKHVTSYALGDKEHPSTEHPLLDFEISDEIEDLDGFEHDPSWEAHTFILYNEEEDMVSCGLSNFWASVPMMNEYDHGYAGKKDVSHRVAKANTIDHDVENWQQLQAKAYISASAAK